MTQRIVIIGTGGHARVIADAVRQSGGVLAGFLDEELPAGSTISDGDVLGRVADLGHLAATDVVDAVVVGIGDNARRRAVVADVLENWAGAAFATVVHPDAVISATATVGAGSVIMAGVVVNTGTRIGEHCILNTRSSIDHDCEIGAFASVAPGAVLGGGVQVGELSAIGIGVTVSNAITIGARTVVGAGAVVVGHIPEAVVAYGVPARVVRQRRPDEPYMAPPPPI